MILHIKNMVCNRCKMVVKSELEKLGYSLGEIAYQLNYSSVSHLSAQFKRVTGLTPSHFKNVRTEKRKPLDELKFI